jgi:hypothetical protein
MTKISVKRITCVLQCHVSYFLANSVSVNDVQDSQNDRMSSEPERNSEAQSGAGVNDPPDETKNNVSIVEMGVPTDASHRNQV